MDELLVGRARESGDGVAVFDRRYEGLGYRADMFDLGPATAEMTRLVSGVRDDQLDAPTPCSEWTVAQLLAHIHQFTSVFTDNARKAPPNPPNELVDDWREAIPAALIGLAEAWRDDSAWVGRVSAGGVEMDAADNAVVAVEELTVHAWDLARATGQDAHIGDAELDQVDRLLELFGGQPFGPPAEVPDGATRLQRTLALTGRNPV